MQLTLRSADALGMRRKTDGDISVRRGWRVPCRRLLAQTGAGSPDTEHGGQQPHLLVLMVLRCAQRWTSSLMKRLFVQPHGLRAGMSKRVNDYLIHESAAQAAVLFAQPNLRMVHPLLPSAQT